jgi:hypothetical protein
MNFTSGKGYLSAEKGKQLSCHDFGAWVRFSCCLRSLQTMELITCSAGKSDAPALWSSEDYQENYAIAAKALDSKCIGWGRYWLATEAEFDLLCTGCATSLVGSTFICHERFNGSRFLTWEIVEGEVFLNEVSLTGDLVNSQVCIRFGGNRMISG